MFARRLISIVMTLIAVQFAVAGGQPLCGGDHHADATVLADAPAGMTHDGSMHHGGTVPCDPTSPNPSTPHTPVTCLAMAGCVATGVPALVGPEIVSAPVTLETPSPEPAILHSITSTPETPPPIA